MLLIKAPSDKLTSPGKKSLNSGDLHSSEIKKLLKVAIKDGAREWYLSQNQFWNIHKIHTYNLGWIPLWKMLRTSM